MPQKMIVYQLHRASIDVLLEYEKALLEKIGDNGGIYVLYKGDRIYYVGKATTLKQRIKQHFNDKHKNKWDAFSLYVVSNPKFIPELERILIALIKPAGNSLTYQREIKRSESELKNAIRSLQNEYLDKLFPSGEKAIKSTSQKSKLLTKTFKGKKYTALLQKDGTVIYNNKKYTSLTAVAKLITKYNVNGPFFWGLR
ncbi:MAG: DUF2924 domain-containing protein [Elusimicrobiota bacterium]|jgi:hypothetical protein|nr:DUF2924 domain-containing protein [Elusimicrobiota bacterium]